MCAWQVKKARARIGFGKLNFASDLDHCRFYLRRFSSTDYNVLFVSAVFDLFPAVRSVHQARFFGFLFFKTRIASFDATLNVRVRPPELKIP